MKLRKNRVGILILLMVSLGVMLYFLFLNNNNNKEVSELTPLTYEKYSSYSLDDISVGLKVQGTALKVSDKKLSYEEVVELESVQEVTFLKDSFIYIVDDNGDIKLTRVSVKDTLAPEITIQNNQSDIEEITIVDTDVLNDIITIKALDKRGDDLVDLEYSLSHDISVTHPSDFDLVITADDGSNQATKTLKVKIEKKVVSTTKPDSSANLITSNLNSIEILVNKTNVLPSDFIPSLVNIPSSYAVSEGYRAHPNASEAFIKMVDAMYEETGLWMVVTSSYRDYEFQGRLYNNAIKSMGYEEAKMLSAKPGASEHQTGLAIDVVGNGVGMYQFGETPQSKWVDQNAHRFGFIVRYQEAFIQETGYNPEPWHLRYLGLDLASKVYDSKVSYEEYLRINR